MDNMPLVSVAVVTYNSSKFVIETLESIKNQSYRNLELIISDDCSTDSTVQICKEWIAENKDRFVRTVLLESPVNTGVSANGNRAADNCQGEWVKSIAGDDLLMPECILAYMAFASTHNDAVYIFSKMKVFGGDIHKYSYIEQAYDERNDKMESMTAAEQKELVLQGETPPAPTAFYNREKKNQLGIHNDERIRNVEDWPKWINVLNKGIKLRFVDQYLVKYRIGGISTSKQWQSVSSYRSKRQVYFYYIFPELYKKNPQPTLDNIIDYECEIYKKNLVLHNNALIRTILKIKKIFE